MREMQSEDKTMNEKLTGLTKKIKQVVLAKSLIKAGTMAIGVIAIILMTFANVGPTDHFDFAEWMTDALIMVGIIIFGMAMGESTGKDFTRDNEFGLYRKNVGLYQEIRKTIRDDGSDAYFAQFFAFYKEKEYRDKVIETLDETIADRSLCEMIADGITADDLDKIGNKVYINGDIKIRKLSDKEYQAVKDVIANGVPYHTPKNTYYLTVFGESDTTSMLEQRFAISKEIRVNTWFTRGWRIAFALAVSFLMAFLTVKDFTEAGKTEAWMNLVFRLFSLVSGFASGFGSGSMDTKLRAELIQNKYEVLSLFTTYLNNGIFKPKTYDEIIQEQIEQDSEKNAE